MGNSETTHYSPETHAYRVVAVLPGSPAEEVGIEAQIDFIRYNPNLIGGRLFSEYLAENEGKEITIQVYNLIQQGNRMVRVKLHRNWGNQQSLLGATIRYESFTDAHNNILAVNDVYLDSPAHEAGLQPFKDYIIGTRELAFKNLDEFAKYVEINLNQVIRFYIYNIDQECIREVALTPKKDWGGQGILGCDVSFGYFNKIPLRKKDLENINQSKGLKNVLGKLTGDKQEQHLQNLKPEIKNIEILKKEENQGYDDELSPSEEQLNEIEAAEQTEQKLSSQLNQNDLNQINEDDTTQLQSAENDTTNLESSISQDIRIINAKNESDRSILKQDDIAQNQSQNIDNNVQQEDLRRRERKFNLLPTSLEFD